MFDVFFKIVGFPIFFFVLAAFPTWPGHREKAGFDRNDVLTELLRAVFSKNQAENNIFYTLMSTNFLQFHIFWTSYKCNDSEFVSYFRNYGSLKVCL